MFNVDKEIPAPSNDPTLQRQTGPRRATKSNVWSGIIEAVIFADLELARRLERAEAVGGASFVEARRRLSPEVGAVWVDVGGTYAMFDGPTSPITQTFGLGLFSKPSSEDLRRLEEFFWERAAPICHEVSPLAGLAVADMLAARGYRPVEFTSVMFRPLPAAGDPWEQADTRVSTRLITGGEEDLWSQVAARGWSEQPELREFLTGLGRVVAASDGSLPFIAYLEGQPVATGLLRLEGGVALFGGASTVPEGRNRGAHRALFEARMKAAVAHGCDLGMICAQPGSTSQRNAERMGFRIAYTRIKWQLTAEETVSS